MTGTIGKRTTVELLQRIFERANRSMTIGGNRGRPLSELLLDVDRADAIGLAVSSFQLESIVHFRPDIAVLLNVNEAHLDRHRSIAEYVRIKSRVFMNQRPDDVLVLPYDDERLRPLARKHRGRTFYVSTRQTVDRGAWLIGGQVFLRVDEGVEKLGTAAPEFPENLLAAVVAARLAGVTTEQLAGIIGDMGSAPTARSDPTVDRRARDGGRTVMTALPWSGLSGREIRHLCRTGECNRPTAGLARGFAQVNLVVLPEPLAADFATFCRLNPQPCPLLEVTKPGSVEPVRMAAGADLRTDLPRYRVFRADGPDKSVRCLDEPTSIGPYWRDDFVSFLIGCSFTFESALLRAGVTVRHIEENRNVPMYRTTIPCRSAGAFAAPLVVSMRPMPPEHVAVARKVTASMPHVHGAPVHEGDPRAIGIRDLARPEYGDAVTIREGEVPVFWACGVTPQEAILAARPEIAITHKPGHMLVTDIPDHELQADWTRP